MSPSTLEIVVLTGIFGFAMVIAGMCLAYIEDRWLWFLPTRRCDHECEKCKAEGRVRKPGRVPS